MECGCKKNQSNPEVLAYLASRGTDLRSATGFGLFLIPDPEAGILEWRTVIVETISYSECVKRGEHCNSFQWIPKGLTIKVKDSTGAEQTVTLDTKADIDRVREKYCSGQCVGCPTPPCWCPDAFNCYP